MATKKKLPTTHPMATAAKKPASSAKPATPAKQAPAASQVSPPPGVYDPVLDANVNAANRGLFDLAQDVGTANQRDTVDYGLGVADINRGAARSAEDLQSQRAALDLSRSRGLEDIDTQRQSLVTSRDRGLEDISTQRGYATEDHATALANIGRQYGQLANRQRQQMNAAGVLRGGAALQAAAKRQANQALDQQPVNTAYGRQISSLDTGQRRLGEDFTTQSGLLDRSAARLNEDYSTQGGLLDRTGTRMGEDTTRALGQLALLMAPPDASNPLGGRNFQDRQTQLTRAARENTAFGIDTAAAKAYQAASSGWNPILPKRRQTTKAVR